MENGKKILLRVIQKSDWRRKGKKNGKKIKFFWKKEGKNSDFES